MSSDAKVAFIAGYGTGISHSLAKYFANAGYKLALVARTQSRLDAAVEGFAAQGVTGKGYSTDLSDPEAVKATIAAVHAELGPIATLFWNPFGAAPAGFLTATPEQLRKEFDLAVTGLIAAVQAAHKDLKATKGSILVTGGGMSLEKDSMAQLANDWDATTWAVPEAGQRKLVHIMNNGLAKDGIYVAEVTVMSVVAGTSSAMLLDPEGKSQLTADAVAEEFWQLHEKRNPAVWYVTKG